MSRTYRVASTGVLALALSSMLPATTQTAIANGDTRTLSLYHTHTRESIEIAFRVNGQYDQAALKKLNWFLRDWRRDEPINMDPRLFDVVWETYRESGSREPVSIVSAYRSPQTNAMLRQRSKAVAEQSQHMLGKAMDMHYTDVPMSRIREIGMKLQRGGVGYYPGNGFVHLDVGSVRAWPRMSYDQLVRLFPDGKTVHLPANGQPLARYEEARAEIEQRNGISMPTYAQAQSKSKGFFATLFGLKDEDEDEAPARVSSGPRSRVATYMESRQQPSQMAAAEPERRAPVIEKAQGNLPKGETFMAATPLPPSRQQPTVVASLSAVDMPLPPRRPGSETTVETTASMAATIPLPPLRAVALTTPTAMGRPVDLPSAITGQSAQNTPIEALAFAPLPEQMSAAPLPPSRPSASARARTMTFALGKAELIAVRLDRSTFSALLSGTSLASRLPALPPAATSRTEMKTAIFGRPTAMPQAWTRSPVQLSSAGFTQPAQKSVSAAPLVFGQLQ